MDDKIEEFIKEFEGLGGSKQEVIWLRSAFTLLLAHQRTTDIQAIEMIIENAENVALLASEETTQNNIRNNIILPLTILSKKE